MKLYDWSAANPRRVRIFLAEKGIAIPVEDAGDPNKPVLRGEFLAAHSHRRVPLLALDDGTEIGEAMAICRYFETLHPEPPLMGTDAKDRALVEMWERVADVDGMHAVTEVFRNSTDRFANRSLAGIPEPIAQIPALIERGKQRVRLFYEKIDRRLAENEFLAGPRFSVADITALCSVDFAIFAGLPIPATCAHVARWHETVSARPSAKL